MVSIKLMSHTQNPEKIIWLAARNCYSQKCACELAQEIEGDIPDDFDEMFNHLYVSGHWSVFEHIDFVFEIEGFSRVAQQQLTRHRFLRWSIQSMRYASFSNADFRYPKGINDEQRTKVEKFAKNAVELYVSLTDEGVPNEQARMMLLLGTKSNAVMSANLRALIDIASVRRCILAQDEARSIFHDIRRLVFGISPLFGRAMMIKCQRLGYCPEMRNKNNKLCGIRPHVDSLNLQIMSVIR